ncbi:hypothetical protein B4O97_03620 [Marispirochaeta aestuarii]|uniref:Helix-turn-helix domain-containing protein n=2 Tax=Marispirochaeta aestuarii TaxID=1963862 RepID=A0A1Y1S1D9_9SPIO|nr:hypothetical protein B4O97_03620 [Marispirochaeta aestuarii]
MMGQLEALTEINQKAVEKMEEITEAIGHTVSRIESGAREVSELRSLVGLMQDIIRDQKTTTWRTGTEIARHFSVNVKTVNRWRKAGIIKGYRASDNPFSRILYDLKETEAAIRERSIK